MSKIPTYLAEYDPQTLALAVLSVLHRRLVKQCDTPAPAASGMWCTVDAYRERNRDEVATVWAGMTGGNRAALFPFTADAVAALYARYRGKAVGVVKRLKTKADAGTLAAAGLRHMDPLPLAAAVVQVFLDNHDQAVINGIDARHGDWTVLSANRAALLIRAKAAWVGVLKSQHYVEHFPWTADAVVSCYLDACDKSDAEVRRWAKAIKRAMRNAAA